MRSLRGYQPRRANSHACSARRFLTSDCSQRSEISWPDGPLRAPDRLPARHRPPLCPRPGQALLTPPAHRRSLDRATSPVRPRFAHAHAGANSWSRHAARTASLIRSRGRRHQLPTSANPMSVNCQAPSSLTAFPGERHRGRGSTKTATPERPFASTSVSRRLPQRPAESCRRGCPGSLRHCSPV